MLNYQRVSIPVPLIYHVIIPMDLPVLGTLWWCRFTGLHLAVESIGQAGPMEAPEVRWWISGIPRKGHGYGSIPMKIACLNGMNIHESHLFWCELQGYYWFWRTAAWTWNKIGIGWTKWGLTERSYIGMEWWIFWCVKNHNAWHPSFPQVLLECVGVGSMNLTSRFGSLVVLNSNLISRCKTQYIPTAQIT